MYCEVVKKGTSMSEKLSKELANRIKQVMLHRTAGFDPHLQLKRAMEAIDYFTEEEPEPKCDWRKALYKDKPQTPEQELAGYFKCPKCGALRQAIDGGCKECHFWMAADSVYNYACYQKSWNGGKK
jgi:hypothetical protein